MFIITKLLVIINVSISESILVSQKLSYCITWDFCTDIVTDINGHAIEKFNM